MSRPDLSRMRRMPGFKRRAAALAVVAAAGAFACATTLASAAGSGPVFAKGGTATVSIDGTTDFMNNFNPALTVQGINVTIVSDGYATLVTLNQKQDLEGYLASKWKATPTQVTFTLKNGPTCADGTKLTASLVKKSIDYMISSKSSGLASSFGPGPYTTSAPNPHTFVFKTATPDGNLLYGFTDIRTGIICPQGLANPTLMENQMYGLGPYTISSMTHGSSLAEKLKPNFSWGPGNVTAKSPGVPGTIIYRQILDQTTAATALQQGQLNVDPRIPYANAQTLLQDPSIKNYPGVSYQVLTPTGGQDFMFINSTSGLMTDPKVRQALLTALRPQPVIDATGDQAITEPTPLLVDTKVRCYPTQDLKYVPKFSVTAAQQVLESDGYTMQNGVMTKNGQPLVVNFVGFADTFGSAPAYIAAVWQQMGAKVNSITATLPADVAIVTGKNFDIAETLVSAWGPDTATDTMLQYFWGPSFANGGVNFTNTNDPILNAAAKKAASLSWGTAASNKAKCAAQATGLAQVWKGYYGEEIGLTKTYTFGNGVDLSKYFTGPTLNGNLIATGLFALAVTKP